MDLKAHMVEEHGAQMSTKDMKDARRIEVDMEFDDSRGTSGRRRGGREREPPPGPPLVPPEPEASRGPGRRAAFNGALTGETPDPGASTPAPPRASPPTTSEEVDPETARYVSYTMGFGRFFTYRMPGNMQLSWLALRILHPILPPLLLLSKLLFAHIDPPSKVPRISSRYFTLD